MGVVITRFALCPDREDPYEIPFREVLVKRDVPSRSLADDKFTLAVTGGTAQQRVSPQYVERLDDVFDS